MRNIKKTIVITVMALMMSHNVAAFDTHMIICFVHGKPYARVDVDQTCPLIVHNADGSFERNINQSSKEDGFNSFEKDLHEDSPECYSHSYEDIFN